MSLNRSLQRLWLWCLLFFIIAATTGILFRVGMLTPLPAGLSLVNIRHAHSHLMFFNWVAPVPMLFIVRHLIREAPEAARSFMKGISFILATGIVAWLFFLLYGYRPVPVGSVSMPISVILSGVIMIGWYVLVAIYLKARRTLPVTTAIHFYDASLLLLVISSLGAWGVAAVQFFPVDNPLLSTAMTHFFLGVFTQGWCIVATLGIIHDLLGTDRVELGQRLMIAPFLLGVPLTFPLGLSAELLTPSLTWAASGGAILMVIALIQNLRVILPAVRHRHLRLWWPSAGCLMLVTLMLAGGALLPVSVWIGEHSFRILYLHTILLGFVSLSFFAAWHQLYPGAPRYGFVVLVISTLLMLVMLIFPTGLLPSWLFPPQYLTLLTVISSLPVLSALLEWVVNWRSAARQ